MSSAPTRQGTRVGEWFVLYALSVIAALLLSAILVEATGGDWRPVVNALLDGSLRRPGRWGETLGTAAPMLLVATGTIISAKAGLINIGQEGQLFVGAAFATYFGLLVGGPGPLNLVLIVVFGTIGGALWAGIAAGLKFWRNVPHSIVPSGMTPCLAPRSRQYCSAATTPGLAKNVWLPSPFISTSPFCMASAPNIQ